MKLNEKFTTLKIRSADDYSLFPSSENTDIVLIGSILFVNELEKQIYVHIDDYGIMCKYDDATAKLPVGGFKKGQKLLVAGLYNASKFILQLDSYELLEDTKYLDLRRDTLPQLDMEIVEFNEVLKSKEEYAWFKVKLKNIGNLTIAHEDLTYGGMYTLEYYLNGYKNSVYIKPEEGKRFSTLGFDYFKPLRKGNEIIAEFNAYGFDGMIGSTYSKEDDEYTNIFSKYFTGGKVGINTFQLKFGKWKPESKTEIAIISESNIVEVMLESLN